MSEMQWAAFAFLFVGVLSTAGFCLAAKHSSTMNGIADAGCLGVIFLFIGTIIAIRSVSWC